MEDVKNEGFSFGDDVETNEVSSRNNRWKTPAFWPVSWLLVIPMALANIAVVVMFASGTPWSWVKIAAFICIWVIAIVIWICQFQVYNRFKKSTSSRFRSNWEVSILQGLNGLIIVEILMLFILTCWCLLFVICNLLIGVGGGFGLLKDYIQFFRTI